MVTELFLEGADEREEPLQPAGAGLALQVAAAGISDAGVGHAGGGHAIVEVDVGDADDAGHLHPFVAAVERQPLFAAPRSSTPIRRKRIIIWAKRSTN